jgi:hypothetical protein
MLRPVGTRRKRGTSSTHVVLMPDDLGQIAKLQPHGGKRVKGEHGDITLKMRGTSRAYIIARLRRDGHDVLLAGVLSGRISAFAAGEEAGYLRRREVRGTGSQNQERARDWAMHKVLSSRPDPKALIG